MKREDPKWTASAKKELAEKVHFRIKGSMTAMCLTDKKSLSSRVLGLIKVAELFPDEFEEMNKRDQRIVMKNIQ